MPTTYPIKTFAQAMAEALHGTAEIQNGPDELGPLTLQLRFARAPGGCPFCTRAILH